MITPVELTSGEINFYRNEGFLLLPGLMSESHACDLHAEVMDLMSQIGGFEGNKLTQSAEYKSGSCIERLIRIVKSQRARNAQEIGQDVLKAVAKWGRAGEDDRTIVIVKAVNV